LLVTGATDRWSPLAEALLLNAARVDHLERLIRPALKRGVWVVSDRFADSTRAYQGAAGGVDDAALTWLETTVVAGERPDLTLVLDAPAALGLERATARGGAARFESKGLPFHERLRGGYQAIAAADAERCLIIDAVQSEAAVADAVWAAVVARLGLPT
jgi:dTMP kinase